MQADSQGKIITFYSYKGGTGRSMELANVAWILASNGKKVLVVDWDLEAPGLHRYFYPFLMDKDLTSSDGLIDFVIDFAVEAATPEKAGEGVEDEDWYKPYANILRYAASLDWEFPRKGTLDFIPAGRQGASYSTRVNSFNWQHFYDRLGGGVFLEAVKDKMKAEYDYILIDSRTGVSDTSGICTVQMPDVLVVCFTLNFQGIEGAAAVASSVYEQRKKTGLHVFPVPMRIDLFEKDKLELRRIYAKSKFAQFPDSIPLDKQEQYWGEVQVPYIAYYGYEEILAPFGDSAGDSFSILSSAERLTSYLTQGEVRQLDADSVLMREEILARYARQAPSQQSLTTMAVDERSQIVRLRREQEARKRQAPVLPYDVFLLHSSRDKPAVERLAEKLKREGLEPWFDKWHLTPGGDWQDELAAGLHASSACAVFIGPGGLGDWASLGLGLATNRIGKDNNFRFFLVLLPGVPEPFDTSSLPPFLMTRTWVDLRQGITDSRGFQSLISAIKGGVPSPVRPISLHNDLCPYPGLRAFDEEQAEFFFGRDADTQRLIEKLKATRFLTVIGPSGSGKSSLVRAGLVPALKRGALPGSDTWAIRVLMPGGHPLQSLALDLVRFYPGNSVGDLLSQMSADERTLHGAVSLALKERQTTERVVWIIDQFEEVFTLCSDERERAQFIANLLYAAAVPDGRIALVLTLRADFYHMCMAYHGLAASIAEQQFLVSSMDADSIRQAIEEPARLVGLEVEEGVVREILNDVRDKPGALPLLQYMLFNLWERRRGQMLTLEAYWESGGLEGTIARRADSIYESFTREEQVIARHVMLRLIRPGEGSEDTPRRALMTELVTSPKERETVENVVQALVRAGLIVASEDVSTGEPLIELSHSALIRGWPRLRQWIDEDRAGLRIHSRLVIAAEEWQRSGRDPGLLYRGGRLTQALDWAEHNQFAVNEREREFLAASGELISREEKARSRLRRLTYQVLVLSILTLISTVVTFYVYRQRNITQEQLERREQLFSILNIDPSPQATLRGQQGAVKTLAFSPDGNILATGGADTTVNLWNADSGKELSTLVGHGEPVVGVALSPNVKILATGGPDGTVKVWDTSSGRELSTFKGHEGAVNTLAFSPDGKTLATGGGDGSVTLWEIALGRPVAQYVTSRNEPIHSLAFSPDGRTLATGGGKGYITLREIASGRNLMAFASYEGAVNTLAFAPSFSPEGGVLATGGADGSVTVCGIDMLGSGVRIMNLNQHTTAVFDITFSPDGKVLASGNEDGTINLWRTATK